MQTIRLSTEKRRAQRRTKKRSPRKTRKTRKAERRKQHFFFLLFVFFVSSVVTSSSAGRAALFLQGVELVVERLEADPQLLGRLRLVALVLLQRPQDVLHLDCPQRAPLRVGRRRNRRRPDRAGD